MKVNYEIKLIDKEVYCDFCLSMACYEGKTRKGPWAFMCNEHFKTNGTGLGIGKGQQIMKRGEYE